MALLLLIAGLFQETQTKTAAQIAEIYKETVVVIETAIKLETGGTIHVGGSGFFVGNNGQVRTCAHVVKIDGDEISSGPGGQSIKIEDYSYWVTINSKRRRYQANLVGWNKYTDEALLIVPGIGSLEYEPADIGDPQKVKVGDKVYVFGTPFSLDNTLTSGIVSGLDRALGINYIEKFIQTDAAINPGNSGSPLINENGEVIGINAAKYTMADNLGFAIPIDLTPVEKLEQGEVKIGYFGAELLLENFPRSNGFQDLKYLNELTGIDDLETLQTLAKITRNQSALAINVRNHKSPAKSAGLRRGDVIVVFNGKKVSSGREVRLAMLDAEIGEEIKITIKRVQGAIIQELVLTATLAGEPKRRLY